MGMSTCANNLLLMPPGSAHPHSAAAAAAAAAAARGCLQLLLSFLPAPPEPAALLLPSLLPAKCRDMPCMPIHRAVFSNDNITWSSILQDCDAIHRCTCTLSVGNLASQSDMRCRASSATERASSAAAACTSAASARCCSCAIRAVCTKSGIAAGTDITSSTIGSACASGLTESCVATASCTTTRQT